MILQSSIYWFVLSAFFRYRLLLLCVCVYNVHHEYMASSECNCVAHTAPHSIVDCGEMHRRSSYAYADISDGMILPNSFRYAGTSHDKWYEKGFSCLFYEMVDAQYDTPIDWPNGNIQIIYSYICIGWTAGQCYYCLHNLQESEWGRGGRNSDRAYKYSILYEMLCTWIQNQRICCYLRSFSINVICWSNEKKRFVKHFISVVSCELEMVS